MKLSKLIPGKKLLLRVYFWVKRQQRIREQRLLSIRLRSIASELRAELPTTLPDGRPWPRISVVTPSLNQGAYIGETIESVIRQEYPNVEHIIIDGGSTDKTLEVVERYRSHLTCFVSEPDKGQSDAINKGFSRATGDILCWLNSDDQLAPGALAAVAMAFATSQADMVSGICELYTDGQLVHRHMTSCADGPLPLADLLDLDNGWNAGQFFYQPEVFFSRALWEKTGAHVKADYYYSMDYELWCRFALASAKLHVVGAPLARFRIHPDQKTADPSKFKNELVKVRNEFVTAHKIQAQPVARPAARFDHTLHIAMVNDNGRRYGAGIAQGRIADSIEMAGHAVKFFDLVSWTEENAQAGEKEFIEAIVQFSPDLVIFGNLHTANRESVTVIDVLSSKFPSFWVTHDFWLFTGRCAYPAECTKYLTGCDASCPTPNQYPDLAPDKIANAWQTKHAFLAGDHVPYFLANSEWSGEFVKSTMALVGGKTKQYVGQLKLGVPADVFRPLQKSHLRDALNIDQKGFVIAYSVSSLSEERKGSRYLVEALRSLDQSDVSVILIGNLDVPFDVPNVKQVPLGYVTDPRVLNAALNAADVYVAPSTMETFGQVFVEAALAGIPSIGFDQTGVRDAIVEGVTGFRVEASAKVLRDAILCLYHDRALCERLGGWARIHAANEFSLESSFHSMFLNWRKLGLVDQWKIPHKIGFVPAPSGGYSLRVIAIWRKVRDFFKFRRVLKCPRKH